MRTLLLALAAIVLAVPASAVTIDWTTVGDPGNPPDVAADFCFAPNCGSVAEVYRISKYEVTNAQYTEFLNEKAKANTLGLYSPSMDSSAEGGITQSGSSGSFTYNVKPGFESKPANFVSFYDSLRFTNWLNNGQGSADTESGAYTLLGGTAIPSNGLTVTRNAGANIFLPSENEWYKAAYWDAGTQSFLSYPTGSSDHTVCAAPGATPNTANCGPVVGNVTDVGAYTGSASANGTFDQGGNVWEWNEQIAGEGLAGRGIRGGAWTHSASFVARNVRSVVGPEFESAVGGVSGFGFRVASLVPEPGTGVLLLTGLAGLAARQGRRKRSL